ncbi:MAG TPA: hypothetical protein PLZ32_11660 [Saprospiraceae bacterium]|nr:hypothetical protein [Saprospiraceae bacterium]
MKKLFLIFGFSIFYLSSSLLASSGQPKEIVMNEVISNVISFESSDFSTSEVVNNLTCLIISVTCECGTYQFQWCDNGMHPDPLETAEKICCRKCGCTIIIDPE